MILIHRPISHPSTRLESCFTRLEPHQRSSCQIITPAPRKSWQKWTPNRQVPSHHGSCAERLTEQLNAPPLDISSVLHGGMHHPTLRSYQANGRSLTKSMLIWPIFVSDDPDAEEVIHSLPGQKRWGINKLEGLLRPMVAKGLKSVILFGVPMKMEKVRAFA